MKLVLAVFVLCTILSAFAKIANKDRDGRWYRYTYTETKVQKEIVTSLIPSSCVHVEPTLPPCRGVRKMEAFPEFGGSQIYPDYMKGRQLIVTNEQQVILAPVNETRTIGWAEYLGLVAPTVTVTKIDLKTKSVIDPKTIVTFSVKGCKPSRLPLGLDRCPVSSGVTIEEIFPSAVVPSEIIPTATVATNNNIISNNSKKGKNIEIEPSSEDDLSNVDMSIPTEELNFR